MTVSEFIVAFLEKKGIDSAYAVIGSAAMWLFHALGNSSGIKAICTNHEQAAVMASDGWSCLKGLPGVVFLTNGPGVTNALSGVAQAWTDSVPVIVISGESNVFSIKTEDRTQIRQYGSQSVPTGKIVRPIVKYYHLLDKAIDVRRVMEEAYSKATEGRPGPVWISVPVDVQNAKLPDKLEGYIQPKEETQDTSDAAAEVKAALLSCQRPLIIAGQGVRQSGAAKEFRLFVEKYQIPVVTSRMGNDVMETKHPLFIGRPGNWGSRASHFAIQTADVILVLGSRLSLNTTGHTPAEFAPRARKYMVDIDPAEFQKPGISFVACIHQDVFRFLEEMKAVPIEDKKQAERKSWCARCRSWKERYPVMVPEYQTAQPISTYHFIDRLSAMAGEDDIIFSDTGSCCNIVSQVWEVKRGQRLRVSGGLSCMGYWVTSIGAARANEGQRGRILCVVGDGSLQMNIQEFGTISLYQLPIKLFVINNNGYQIIRISQHTYMNDDFFAISPQTGVGLADTQRIAAAYGIAYQRLIDPAKADEAIEWAFAQKSAAILEVVVNEDQVMLPRLTSKIQPDGTLKSAAFEDLAPFLSEEELNCNMRG